MVNRGRKTKIGSRPDLYCHSPRRKSRFQDRVTNIAIVPPRDELPFPFLSSLFYSFPPSSSSFFRHQRFSSVSSCTAAQQQCEPTPPTIEQNRLKTYSDNEPSSVSFARLRTRARLSFRPNIGHFSSPTTIKFLLPPLRSSSFDLGRGLFFFLFDFSPPSSWIGSPKESKYHCLRFIVLNTCVVISWLGQARRAEFPKLYFPRVGGGVRGRRIAEDENSRASS